MAQQPIQPRVIAVVAPPQRQLVFNGVAEGDVTQVVNQHGESCQHVRIPVQQFGRAGFRSQ